MASSSTQEILDLISKSLSSERPVKGVTVESSMDTIPEWDSLGHLSVLANLDRRYDGKVASITELASARSVREILDILQKKKLL